MAQPTADVMKTGQVFVSHTSDMARFPEERSFAQAAVDAVTRARMTPVDMRYFAARDGKPAEYCQAQVRECEIYVAVVGFRYGSIVPGEAVSYTELEFQAASDAGLPRLVFLLDEATIPGEGQADADRGLVDGFRKRLRDAGLVVRAFSSHAGLELEVFHALTELAQRSDDAAAAVGQSPDYRHEIAEYLQRLIDWVSTDPWPRDRRFSGPVLTPAAIERKLRVSAPGRAGEENLDADDLTRRCRRLIVLGGPGSGKTWLAKRTVRRSAEAALDALKAGVRLEEIELPIYTTCSSLFSAKGNIREAVVSSALDQLGDLGGSMLNASLRTFLADRNGLTVLVIDSLDEAHGSQERLRQSDTLPWRIVLTTRPSSWNQQLAIDDINDLHRVGELQPLRYPDDVEPFIRSWFASQPERGEDLVSQLARRPGLQQASSVPLVLAFYCIVGGNERLPDFRRDLYGRVLNRMLTGRWRGNEDRQPDVQACLQTLRAWAWPETDTSHPVAGVGTWADDVLTEPAGLNQASLDALDHVAMPLGPADVDTGKTVRRFIHRSVREHLVAEFVARLPVGQATEVLLPHLWYDPDWEYSAPAAIAMHPQRDQLLHDLICRAAMSGQLPADISVIDAGWSFRGLLARVIPESSEADWSPELAGIISRARLELAKSGRIDVLGGGALWASSNRLTCDTLLELLTDPANGWAAGKLVSGVVQLAATAEDRRLARNGLLGLLPGIRSGFEAARFVRSVVSGVVQLAATAEDRRQARESMLRLLPGLDDEWVADELAVGVSRLGSTVLDRRLARDALLRFVPSRTGGHVIWLVVRSARLAVTDAEKRETRELLLRLLPDQADSWVADEIALFADRLWPTAEDDGLAGDPSQEMLPDPPEVAEEPPGMVSWRVPPAFDSRKARSSLLKLLTSETNGRTAAGLGAALIYASPTDDEKSRVRKALLSLLVNESDGRAAGELAGVLGRLALTPADSHQAREALLRLLAAQTRCHDAAWLADGLIQADPSPEQKRLGCGSLTGLLTAEISGHDLARLANRISRLDPTTEEKRQTREMLLRFLAGSPGGDMAARLAELVTGFDPTAKDRRQAREALLKLLAVQADAEVAQKLAVWVSRLDPTAEDRRQARKALLGLLAGHPDGSWTSGLLSLLVQLTVTAEDRRQVREALLELLAGHPDGSWTSELLSLLVQLTVTAEDRRQVREALLELLLAAVFTGASGVAAVAAVIRIAVTPEDKRQALDAVLGLLGRQVNNWLASELAAGVIMLGPTAEDKRLARDALLARLAGQISGSLAVRLADALVPLDPTAADISNWPFWGVPPSSVLLAAVRRNSELGAWLASLPVLAPLSKPR